MKNILFVINLMLATINIGAQEKIAYNVLEDATTQDYEIYVMDTDGTNTKNITNSKSVDWVYESFGGKIYFLSDRDECFRCFHLYEMDARGDNLKKITNFMLADSWLGIRNNGNELIVKPKDIKEPMFYIIDSNGEIKEKIVINLAYANDPAFSPDGYSIVFRGGTKKSPQEIGFTDALYVMNLKSLEMKKITSHANEGEGKQWAGYLAAAPRWRSDGKISYASKKGSNYNIYTINPDGSGKTSVTSKDTNQVFHHWNKKGELVFEASMDNHSGYDLYKRNWEGQIIQLTSDSQEQYAPVFVISK